MASGNDPKGSDQADETAYNCICCKQPDHLEDMVQCDNCQGWSHLGCAKVNHSIANKSWRCPRCNLQTPQQRSLQSATALQPEAPLNGVANAESTRHAEQRSTSSSSSSRKRRELRLLAQQNQLLERERELITRQTELLQRQQVLLQQVSDDEGDSVSTKTSINQVRNTVHADAPTTDNNIQADRNQYSVPIQPCYKVNSVSYPAYPQVSNTPLDFQRMLARQAIKQELPPFSGKPEEWHIFISMFEQTTLACGYADVENLSRLQKSLKGDARKLVESQLSLPSHVSQIISSLKMIYGRPEIVIRAQIEKIKREPMPKPDRLETLIQFSISVKNLCAAVEASKIEDYFKNPLLLQELVDRLPAQSKLNWAHFRRLHTQVDLHLFSSWLEELATEICSVIPYAPYSKTEGKVSREHNLVNIHTDLSNNASNLQERKCKVCEGNCKSVDICRKFQEFNMSEKWRLVKSLKLCRNCLNRHRSPCKAVNECGFNGCRRILHKLLHNHHSTPLVETGAPSTSTQMSHQIDRGSMLFRIVPVILIGPRVNIETYAFIDEGSSISMIDDSLVTSLQLQGNPKPLMLKWTGGNHRVVENSSAFTLKIAPKHNEATIFDLNVRSVPSLELPSQTVNMDRLAQNFKHLKRLPIHSYFNEKPGLLIGIDHWHLTVPLKIKEGGEGEPIATKTRLGWCIGGNYTKSLSEDVSSHFHICECQNSKDKSLDELVRNYFTVESMGVTQNKDASFTIEEKKALQIMKETTVFKDNRYEVGLLWRFDKIRLPNSYSMAFARLRCLESQFKYSPALLDDIGNQLGQHLAKGYIRELIPGELDADYPHIWYLPFFPVKNLNKPGKVRLVWDAAAKVDGLSLNDALLKGPDLNASLLGVMFRFRERKVALTADIQEMFHRVAIRPADQHAQRFLWRDGDITKKPRTYVMTSMTFGATCSPFQAQYVKNLNAARFESEFPRAVRAIHQNHYVDDLLDSVDSEDEAVKLAREIKLIHAAGGFHLRNFRSNSRKVEQAMNEVPLNIPYQFASPENEIEKVLGIFWDTKADVFTYSLKYNKSSQDILSGQRIPTKRETLRTLMSIYDPSGYLAHFLVNLKILQQDLWRCKLGWDDLIPDEAFKKWLQWIKQLPLLEDIKIPRFYLKASVKWEECKTDLHIFVDASTAACAAVAYIRIESVGNVEVKLVGAKTKVAPLKLLSVPRLELIAAVLGVRLAKNIKELHSIHFSNTYYWSDSKVVLAWIHSNKKLTQFVSFRISEIHEICDANDWRYISTNYNVADLATKWHEKTDLSMNSKWFLGPSFLRYDEKKWPSSSSIQFNDPLQENLEENTVAHHAKAYSIIEFQRFSNWDRLLRSTAYVRRFIAICCAKTKPAYKISNTGLLTANELEQSEKTLFIEAQKQLYAADIVLLKQNKALSRHSLLRKLSPFIDEFGILRIQGRIEASVHCQYDTKYPIILSPFHRITELIAIREHRQCLHNFNETVVANLRQRFYIPRLRRLLSKIKQNCLLCRIISARPQVPQMAPLPAARLASYCPPFTFTGVDLFGPLSVTVRRRPEKRWGVIFTCLSVRCIHLELTSTLSTDGFLLCLRNFSNRRGQPREIYCDRGTNFIGAEKLLRQQIQEMDFDRIAEETTKPTMQWRFNPPSAPHMGGAWERLIRSIKAALYVMIPPYRNPSPEVLQSALIEVEYIINSRPLTYVPVDSVEVDPLTPNMLLLGSTHTVKVLGNPTDDATALKLQWKASQQIAQRFWKKWISEYLPTLTRRSKWFEPCRELKIGDLVIVIDENCKQRQWPKGRVLEVIPSKDGHIRKAIVQTTQGILERPAAKLAIIDVAIPVVDSGQRGGV